MTSEIPLGICPDNVLGPRMPNRSRRMDIGAMGWWHHDNQGDTMILENMTRALAPHRLVPIDMAFSINKDMLWRLNRLDFVVLGGGGLFQDVPPRPFDTFDSWGRQLRKPIGIVGLGVDAVQPEFKSAVHALVDQSRFFYVRDRASQKAIGHPKVQVAPDLTFLYPLNNSDGKRAAPERPAMCGVNLRRAPGLKAAPWVRALQELPLRLRGIPFSSLSDWHELEILQKLDEECATVFDVALYRDLDLMVGTAFHSVVFGVQAAVPVIAIAYSPKVGRLMADIGLEDFVLQPDEWRRLPALVERVLVERDQLVARLQDIARVLTRSINEEMMAVRAELEAADQPVVRSGPLASIVVVGGRSSAANLATMESCLHQTYQDVEIILVMDCNASPFKRVLPMPEVKIVTCGQSDSLGERLNCGFASAAGDYRSWITAGSLYAPDSIDCMVSRLQEDPTIDMVYSDYYVIDDEGRLGHLYSAAPASRLFRRNVIGPSFLFRRSLADRVGFFRGDSPYTAYDFWLRASEEHILHPLHASLFYYGNHQISPDLHKSERQVRRQWRSQKPRLVQFLWRVIDSETVEDVIARPVLGGLRLARRVRTHPGYQSTPRKSHENR